ncbi:TPA: hypothetical protein HA225_01410 [Candidatus Micrarchaeota archaeon]|nr:hypothetical protein [Candidatus Micrarchaeota archaeon]
MAIKSFNIDQDVYARFSGFCRENGISMSKQVETFMASQVEEEPKARADYLRKLDRLRKGKFISVNSFAKRYGLE